MQNGRPGSSHAGCRATEVLTSHARWKVAPDRKGDLMNWKSVSLLFAVSVALGVGSPAALLAHEVPAKVPKAAKDRPNPVPRTDEAVQAGKASYATHCQSCHGASGRGDGPKVKSPHHPPPDLTKVLPAQTDGEIFWKTSRGGGSMPSYGKKLSEEERWQLVHFLKALGGGRE